MFSSPWIYSTFQNVMGADAIRRMFVRDFVRPFDGCSILDIGCGPADILGYLPSVKYHGYDIDSAYISRAVERFGQRGQFHCEELTSAEIERMGSVDIVMALGLLHHLDDPTAIATLNLAHTALKPGGRLVTFDPCFEDHQSPIARFLIGFDRGQNVRTGKEYENLVSMVFDRARVEVRHRNWIPYTHCYMECMRK